MCIELDYITHYYLPVSTVKLYCCCVLCDNDDHYCVSSHNNSTGSCLRNDGPVTHDMYMLDRLVTSLCVCVCTKM